MGVSKTAVLPVSEDYTITAVYGQTGSLWKNGHLGIDFVTSNREVYAVTDGTVRVSTFDAAGWGNYVSIGDAQNLRHIYCHLDKVDVKVGQVVKAGQKIGIMGKTGKATGVHLHYQINTIDGTPQNPAEFLKIANRKGAAVDTAVYKDDADIANYAKGAVYELKKRGIMVGDTNGYFRPDAPLTRQEAAVLILKAIKE